MTAHLPPGYRLEPLDESRKRDIYDLDAWAFPIATSLDDLLATASPLPWDRTFGVVAPDARAGELAAMYASYPFQRFPVPGGELPAGGLTWVGVHPQHRRRGILTAMIDDDLARCATRGEPLAALFAAEYAIYGRFGYGRAADDLRLEIPRGTALRDVAGADQHTVRIEHASQEAHGELVAHIHRAAGRAPTGVEGLNRPGWVTRETPELQASFWDDSPVWRQGRESARIVIVERDGAPRGYCRLRRKLDWETAGPRGQVSAGEVVALDAAAARALWGVLLDLDLSSVVAPFLIPVDDVVTQLLVDRRAALPRLADNLWVRLVDVGAALAGRRYAADVDVVVGVRDDRLPANAGSWRLQAGAFGNGSCERTDAPADLELDVRELGAAYLGGVTLAALAAAGSVTERTPGALARAAAAFAWPIAPGASWVF
ncbi:acetyltransferase [Xylanimonas cellulosilytica DSM 15894]|uniref:Acetyltransferase n=1 Tax=Xylanimonas cellulosilytica (strain DSM 15894 / JCM 12276 / CECT 5975 / KCTC 9989 / LMG 20990 / NBRC 107835 / XIL07) TaxID=446471 RepID=D1BUZ7_XYLCX|nr:GNAT family N-acetyltransferase [Xylanimonas cellulosilytica]ACZ31236.1 acetyltransferase [Xylanimonas cellulosilytica DSM 15894]